MSDKQPEKESEDIFDPRGFNFDKEGGDKDADPLDQIIPEEGETAREAAFTEAAKPESDAWGWSEQYGGSSRKKKNDVDQGGSIYEVGDPMLDSKFSDLAEMYVSDEKVQEVHQTDDRITFKPPEKERPSFLAWFMVLLLILAVAGGTSMALKKVDTGRLDENGQPVTQSYLLVLFSRYAGLTYDPDSIEGKVTSSVERLQEVWIATKKYQGDKGNFPRSIKVLVDAKYLNESLSTDGWGKPYLFNALGEKVRCSGLDGQAETSDDIVYDADHGMLIPDSYNPYLKRSKY